MAKKSFLTNENAPWANGARTPEQEAQDLYGGAIEKEDHSAAVGRRRERRIERIPIGDIRPDHQQPRRAVPSIILRQVTDTGNASAVLNEWDRMVQDDLGMRFDPRAVVGFSSEAYELPEEPKPIALGYVALLELAGSIRQEGLANPITVFPDGEGYAIETGERRWLAYNILFAMAETEADQDRWMAIPARVVSEKSVWRQAAENSQRDNLNAVARARQYALLLMSMYPDMAFQTYQACRTDQDFYAQALELTTPYGRGNELMAAMGVRSYSAFNRYQDILRCAPKLWVRADDENWSEREIFRMQKVSEESRSAKGSDRPTLSSRMDRFSQIYVRTTKQIAKNLSGAGQDERAQMAEMLEELARKIRRDEL